MAKFSIKKGQVARYALMPQVAPRMNALFFSGFANLAYFIALVYRAVNILPSDHPYLLGQNIGKFSIRNVFSEASSHISFDLKNIDKVVVFFSLIAGVFILFFQFFLLATAMIVQPASAQEIPFGLDQFFITQQPENDLALRMLDAVFGVPDIFGSIEMASGQPTGFHTALHGLFELYSYGLLIVAAIILVYFIFAVLAETAQTGTPFGKRYNHVWAPIRLVFGIGLLVPITLGLNASQWVTLYSAKLGSGFATTGWNLFNAELDNKAIAQATTAGGETSTFVATPEIPALKDLAAFMMLAKACKHAYEATVGEIQMKGGIQMYIVTKDNGGQSAIATSYTAAVRMVGLKDIQIRFGWKDTAGNTTEIGGVKPYCGEVVLQNTEDIFANINNANANGQQAAFTPGTFINMAYFMALEDMWDEQYDEYKEAADAGRTFMDRAMKNPELPKPKTEIRGKAEDRIKRQIAVWLPSAVSAAEIGITDTADTLKYGWGGASLWYNQIANANGQVTTATLNKPQIKTFPVPMTKTCKENKQENDNTTQLECYSPTLADGKTIEYDNSVERQIAIGLSDIFNYWYINSDDTTGNAFIDVINVVLGLDGLFDMCKNSNIHPLAQLSSLGKGMIEAAVRNLGISVGSGAGGILQGYFGPMLSAASQFFSTVASIGILLGFILFYVVPFLPFVYFMFALGGWIKGIFEAMVGVPLWALAHLRIDGEGLPGEAAINGYFLIFEIFIRPILIIFGFIASIIIFSAMIKMLNSTFVLVVSNVGGFSDVDNAGGEVIGDRGCPGVIQGGSTTGTIEWLRGPVDEFFFTVLYAIVVYMTAMSCFKLIDQVPNNILRWMGQGVQTFNDQSGEPAEGLLSKIAIGGSMMSQNLQIAGSFKQSVSSGAKGLTELAKQ